MKNLTKYIRQTTIVFISYGMLLGCGVSSGTSSSGKGSGSGMAYDSSMSLSPGGLARIQNQSIASSAIPNLSEAEAISETPGGQTAALYNDLGSSNPVTRKNAERTLKNLVDYDHQYLEELKNLEKDNRNPKIWFEVNQIIKEAEKAKAKELDEEIKNQIAESEAADSGSK